MGVVGTSTICHGTWVEPYPPVPWVVGRKPDLLQSVELAEACKMATVLLTVFE